MRYLLVVYQEAVSLYIDGGRVKNGWELAEIKLLNRELYDS